MAQAREQSVFQSMSRARTQLARRFRQIPQLLRTEGLTAVSAASEELPPNASRPPE